MKIMPAKGTMLKESNNGPKTEPCVTPQVREAMLEENLLVLTEKILLDK